MICFFRPFLNVCGFSFFLYLSISLFFLSLSFFFSLSQPPHVFLSVVLPQKFPNRVVSSNIRVSPSSILSLTSAKASKIGLWILLAQDKAVKTSKTLYFTPCHFNFITSSYVISPHFMFSYLLLLASFDLFHFISLHFVYSCLNNQILISSQILFTFMKFKHYL